MRCPKCQTENPDTQKYCGACAAPLTGDDRAEHSITRTIETRSEELTTGSTFAGRYQIIEKLGTGGMGKVYRVLDKKLNEEVALKLIRSEIASDNKILERFKNELKLARKVSQKNVGRMFDMGEEAGTHFITMEYVPGEDLKSFIRRVGQIPVGKSIAIARQICAGLSEAHGIGIVHRDLKPSNIMIDKEGNARILDFGIARSLSHKGGTGEGVMIGTPEYMSPEQAEAREVDRRSDIYSLGIILYEMVTGRLPFEGDTPLSLAIKHKGETPGDPRQWNAQLSDDISRVILKCMMKSRQDRYQSADQLLFDLDRIEAGLSTSDTKTPRRTPITSKEINVKLGTKKVIVLALVLIVLIAGSLIVSKLLRKKEPLDVSLIENSLAVISFENMTGDQTYDHLKKVIPSLLITNLENTGSFYVMTWERMHDLLMQMGESDVEEIDSELGFELCRREGVRAIILGSYSKAGETFVTNVKVLDVQTRNTIRSTSSRGNGVDSILASQIDELSRNIITGIGTGVNGKVSSTLISDVTTSSMEAYSYFIRGQEAAKKSYLNEARGLFEQAVRVDPTFASAYLALARLNMELGDYESGIDSWEKALQYSSHVTEKERLYIEAGYALRIEGDGEKRIQIFEQMAEKYPKEKRVQLALADHFRGRKMFDEAITKYNAVLALDPNSGESLYGLAYLYAELGNFDLALDYIDRYARIDPDDAQDAKAEIFFKRGDYDQAISLFEEKLKIAPHQHNLYWAISYIYAFLENYSETMKWMDRYITATPSPGTRAVAMGCKGFYYYFLGDRQRAQQMLQDASELASNAGHDYGKGFTDIIRVWIYYENGEFERGKNLYDDYLSWANERSAQNRQYYKAYSEFYWGLLDVKSGRIDSARDRVGAMRAQEARLSGDLLDLIKYQSVLLETEILLAEKKFDEAIEVGRYVRTINPVPIRYDWRAVHHNLPFWKDVLARAYQGHGDLEKAITEYERLMNISPGSNSRLLIHPKYHYRLARLYEQTGENTKAVEHYEKFLTLWKDADPGLPEVADARKRVVDLS